MLKYHSLTVALVLVASCASALPHVFSGLKEARFASKANFSRNGYIERFPIYNKNGKKVMEISCFSLNDEQREKFALVEKTDPVADLSCYVKDVSKLNEFTMLGISGESLQFTPGFFWFSDVSKCGGKSYMMESRLRNVKISFMFSKTNRSLKTSDMFIRVAPDPGASNVNLTEKSYRSYCL